MTKQIYRKLGVFALIFVLGLSIIPAYSYAKDGNNNNNSGRGNRSERIDDRNEDNDDDRDSSDDKNRGENNNGNRENASNRSCRRIFRHLFSRNFFMNNDNFNSFMECLRPFGINARFSGMASSTPDITAPIITNLSIKPNTTKVNISWLTNEKSDSTVFWSTSANIDVNSSSTASSTQSALIRNHQIVIENLTASTTYFIIVRSKDASSNIGTSSETSFTTKTTIPDNFPPVVSEITLLVGTSTVNVGWKTNENATSRVYYGTSIGLDVNASTTNFIENSTLKKNHTLTISNLATSTTYYFAIESKDVNNNRTVTPTFTTTTSN